MEGRVVKPKGPKGRADSRAGNEPIFEICRQQEKYGEQQPDAGTGLISHKVFLKSFCKSQFPAKVNSHTNPSTYSLY